MRSLLPLLLALLVGACAPEPSAPPVDACEGECPEVCPEPQAPAGCPADRVVETIDLVDGCPILVCAACPQVEVPPCDEGFLEAERDEATGCATGYVCNACPSIEPPACDGATGEIDPSTGCLAGWLCPTCEEDETGCGNGSYEAEDAATGCTWIACCAEIAPPSCMEAGAIEDEATGCTVGWTCPGGDWTSVDGLHGEALRDSLHLRISGHRSLSYDAARDEIFGSLDVIAGEIECIYTGRRTAPDGTRTPGDMNTEHSWPQSQGADRTPARSDLHHLFPTDMGANSRRGSLDFGETDCASSSCSWTGGGSEVGPSVEGGGTIFEVRPLYRGDIARAHFYFSVRYELGIPASEETVLRRWHDEDPPSSREADRNDGIERIQRNRNPFVDRPDFVDRIADF